MTITEEEGNLNTCREHRIKKGLSPTPDALDCEEESCFVDCPFGQG